MSTPESTPDSIGALDQILKRQRAQQLRPTVVLRCWPLAKVKLPRARVKTAPGIPTGTEQRALRKMRR